MATIMTDTLIPEHEDAAGEHRLHLAIVVHATADELAAEAAATDDEEVRRAWVEAEVLREALGLGTEAFEQAWLGGMLRSVALA